MNREQPRAMRRDRRGFTLIELLVVLTIFGIFAGLVSAIVRPDDRAAVRAEADRVAQLLDLAADEARLSGRSIAWTAESGAYRFYRLRDNVWSEIRDLDQFRARTLPQGIRISDFRVENGRSPDVMRLQLDPAGSVVTFDFVVSQGATRYRISASPIGEVSVVPASGSADGHSSGT